MIASILASLFQINIPRPSCSKPKESGGFWKCMQNMRKGTFARAKLAGKRVLELGAGMGLGGIAMSLMGADVTLTGAPPPPRRKKKERKGKKM